MQNPFTTTFSKTPEHISINASVLGSGGGFGYSMEKTAPLQDIGVEIDTMLEQVISEGKKVLVGIDEVSKTKEMIQFVSEYGRWLRAGSYSMYRDRLNKRGILNTRQGYISFALPFFADYIKEYHH